MGTGFFFFVFLIASFLGIVIFLSWLFSRKREARPKKVDSDAATAEQFVETIHASVKRYKNLHQSNIGNTFYWTAHSKRYVLRISLSVLNRNKYELSVNLEGAHQQNFSLERPGWLSSKLVKMESRLYFTSGPSKEAGISRSEIEPFLEPLEFFDKVEAREGILSGIRTLDTESSMENWPQTLGSFIRLASFLMDTGLRKEILTAKDILCPYCRSDFSETTGTVSCRECSTRHHKECWEEVGRCSVFGCNSKSEIIITQI